jgi:glutamate formiminotransferase
VERIDLARHDGAHPRLGAVDVVPFVPAEGNDLDEATAARDRFVRWLGEELGVPAFAYGGPDRPTLPEIRRGAFAALRPDAGPARPHPRAGATAVGARRPLVAYNLWLATPDLALARSLARSLRGPAVRALGLAVGRHVQVSCNLLQPESVGPAAVYDAVAAVVPVARAELVGLVPRAVLDTVDRGRWTELDLDPDRTVETRLARCR